MPDAVLTSDAVVAPGVPDATGGTVTATVSGVGTGATGPETGSASPLGAVGCPVQVGRSAPNAEAMGSTYTVDLYGADRIQMEAAADAAFEEVRRLDELLSNYRPESEWSQVNRRAAQGPMKSHP